MKHGLNLLAVALLCSSVIPTSTLAQATVDQGTNPYSSLHGGDLDSVVLSNANLLLHIPLISYPQRGNLHLGFFVAYDNLSFSDNKLCTTFCTTRWYMKGDGVHIMPDLPYTNFLTDTNNNKHYYAITPDGSTHRMESTSDGLLAVDATGFHFDSTAQIMTDRDGVRYSGDVNSEWPFGPPGQVEDPNGNLITTNCASGTITDSVGRTIPIPPGPFACLGGSVQTSDFSGCTGPLATNTAYLWSPPGANGGTSIFKVCNAEVPVSYDPGGCFPSGNCYPFSANVSMIQSIVLPNLTTWTFQYDGLGNLIEIILPTEGSISYKWNLNRSKANLTPPVVSSCVGTRSINSQDGSGPHTWTYSGNCGPVNTEVVTVADPNGNQVVHTFNFLGGTTGPVFETETQYYQGSSSSGVLLKTVNTGYSYTSSNLYQLPVIDVVPTSITTTWPNGKVNQVQKTYDTGFNSIILGQVLEQRDYDYGNGAPGALLRRTDTTYMAVSGSSYLTNNLLTLPHTVTTYDGGGIQRALTTYAYDGATLVSSGVSSTYHNPAPPDGAFRGNQTSVTRWLNSPPGNLLSTKAYYDTGEVQQSVTPNGNATTFIYTCQGTFVQTVTNPLNQVTTYNPDCNTGLNLSVTDSNNQPTSYTYDSMWRLATASYPDGGLDTISHQETTFPFTATLTKKITSSVNYVKTNVFDGLGRLTQSQLTSDPSGTDYTVTTYDPLGHVASVTNPYRTTGDSTYGATQNQYDALNRTTLVTKPDGSKVQTAYCGPTTLVTDEATHWRRGTADGLGRLIEVDEPNSTTASVNVCPGTSEPIWVTTYTYDALNNLASVTQGGSRNRSFAFDSVSRMTSSSNPESGIVNYTYDGDNNVRTKADARAVTITYSYDTLDRLTGRTYSNGDPAVGYTYDQAACLGQSSCYNVGRRTGMTDAGGSESLSYDKMGRELAEQRTTSGITKTTNYSHNYDGSLATLTYPSGRVITYSYNGAAQPTSATDIPNSIAYAANGSYAPQGALAALTTGQYNSTIIYNSRLQPCWIYEAMTPASLPVTTACTGNATAGSILDLKYNFNLGASDNGNVAGITNDRDSTRSQTFT
jgi:YD repeat-containing protein